MKLFYISGQRKGDQKDKTVIRLLLASVISFFLFIVLGALINIDLMVHIGLILWATFMIVGGVYGLKNKRCLVVFGGGVLQIERGHWGILVNMIYLLLGVGILVMFLPKFADRFLGL